MLAQVLITEANSFVAMWRDLKLPDGRDRIVRHGHGPHRAIQTGSGLSRSVAPRCATGATWAQRRKSASPCRSCRSGRGGRERILDALLPVLYLRGVSTGAFQEVLTALLGKDAPNLSPAVTTRLTRSGRRIMTPGSSVTSQRGDTRSDRRRSFRVMAFEV